MLNQAGSLSHGHDAIYRNDWTFVASKTETNPIYGWPMTYWNTPNWDYFSWGYLGSLAEPVRSIYTADGAGWNSRFLHCCGPGWTHIKIWYQY